MNMRDGQTPERREIVDVVSIARHTRTIIGKQPNHV